MDENEFVLSKNQKENEIFLNGYRYNKTNRINKNLSTLWRYADKSECNGSKSITIDSTRKCIQRAPRHVCLPGNDKNIIFLKMSKLKNRLCQIWGQ